MNRLIATFEHLWRKYGQPARIRCGIEAYQEFADGDYDADSADGYFALCGDFAYRGVNVLRDPSLPAHEVAWDMSGQAYDYVVRGLENSTAAIQAEIAKANAANQLRCEALARRS